MVKTTFFNYAAFVVPVGELEAGIPIWLQRKTLERPTNAGRNLLTKVRMFLKECIRVGALVYMVWAGSCREGCHNRSPG